MRAEGKGWLALVGNVLAMLGAIWVPHLVSVRKFTSGHPILRIALDVLPFVFVPLVSKVPGSNSEPIPMKRWAMVIALLFLAELGLELLDARFAQNGYLSIGLFAMVLVAVLGGTFLILYWKKVPR